jgi:SAM-dependent methyltransferase
MRNPTIGRIIAAYDDPVIRAYCWARFWILRQRFLDEIGQYLPPAGVVLDIGCGFGLFSLYYAATAPGRFVRGLDLNARRIGVARRAAARLGIHNVQYEQGDARDFKGDGEAAAAYMLDIVHHIAPAAVAPLLAAGRAAAGQGRRHAAGAEAVVHVGARSTDVAPHAGALLERRRAGRRARRGGVRRPPAPHGRPPALPAHPLYLRGARVSRPTPPGRVAHGGEHA